MHAFENFVPREQEDFVEEVDFGVDFVVDEEEEDIIVEEEEEPCWASASVEDGTSLLAARFVAFGLAGGLGFAFPLFEDG